MDYRRTPVIIAERVRQIVLTRLRSVIHMLKITEPVYLHVIAGILCFEYQVFCFFYITYAHASVCRTLFLRVIIKNTAGLPHKSGSPCHYFVR